MSKYTPTPQQLADREEKGRKAISQGIERARKAKQARKRRKAAQRADRLASSEAKRLARAAAAANKPATPPVKAQPAPKATPSQEQPKAKVESKPKAETKTKAKPKTRVERKVEALKAKANAKPLPKFAIAWLLKAFWFTLLTLAAPSGSSQTAAAPGVQLLQGVAMPALPGLANERPTQPAPKAPFFLSVEAIKPKDQEDLVQIDRFIPVNIPGKPTFWWSTRLGRFIWRDTLTREYRQLLRKRRAKRKKPCASQKILLLQHDAYTRRERSSQSKLRKEAVSVEGLEQQLDEFLEENDAVQTPPATTAAATVKVSDESFLKKLALLLLAGILSYLLCKFGFADAELLSFAGLVGGVNTSGAALDEKQEQQKKNKERKQKRARKARTITRKILEEKKRVSQAQDYQVFPCIVQLDDAMGSHGGMTLDGRNNVKKARAPMFVVDANGRHNAAIIKAIAALNERRHDLGLDPIKVDVTDVIFTEFRDGADTAALCALMESKGYAPAGPGVFLRLRHKDGSPNLFTKWVLSEVVSTGQDLRSYGRSWTTSPALEIISHETPVFVVDFETMGLDTDGMSAFTQRLFETAAFQARLNTLPADMRSKILNFITGKQEDLKSTCVKGLFIGAKLLWNVQEQRAQWVSKETYRAFLDVKNENGDSVGLLPGCPEVQVGDTIYRAGIFVNSQNMAKGPGKSQLKSLVGENGKGSMIEGKNFFSFIIAEQYFSQCSVGWQTLQLIHEKIVDGHLDDFKNHIDEKLQRVISSGLNQEIKEELVKDDGGFRLKNADLAALSLMQEMGGKGVGRLAFGGGLSCEMDYVLEWGAMPQGWAIHNPPRKLAGTVDETKEHYEMFQSRYPQQGFESLLYLKVLTATQLAKLKGDEFANMAAWEDETKAAFLKPGAAKSQSAQLQFIHAMMMKQRGSFDERHARVGKTLQAMVALLPFIKAGGCFLSHDDQFGKLRGDSDGDKNWWSYEPWLVAVVKEINEVIADLPVPRLEIQGSGMSLGKNFSEESYYDVVMSKKISRKEKLKLYELICAPNNGQGPVGLIANLTTVPLSRLDWDIVDGKLVWKTKGAREFFAYLLLMQQTAIDMQKRVYPAPSLLLWAKAMLFKTATDTAEALVGPNGEKDKTGHYRQLGKKETIWTMSTKFSMELDVYQEGYMYNERVLSHWCAWVTNGLKFGYDFLANPDVMAEASAILGGGEASLVEFFTYVSSKTGVDVDVLAEGWVMASDLISWKKGASLTEVNGVPAAGLGKIWQLVVGSYADAKAAAGLKGDPIEHLSSLFKGKIKEVAQKGIDWNYRYTDSKGAPCVVEFTLYLDSRDLAVLLRAFAALTDADSHEVAESERMQGDTISSASDKKRVIRECFSHRIWEEHNSKSYYQPKGKGKLSLEKLVTSLFSQDARWSPERKKAVTAAMLKCIIAAAAKLANEGGYASLNKGAEGWSLLVKNNLVDLQTASFVSQGEDQEAIDRKVSNFGPLLDSAKELLESEKFRPLTRCALRQDTCGFPTVTPRGDLPPQIAGRGWGSKRVPLFEEFLTELSKFQKNNKSIDLAVWTIDTMLPAFGEGFNLASDLEARRTLINEPSLTQEEIDRAQAADRSVKLPTLSNAHTLSEEKLRQITVERYSLVNLLKFAATQVHESKKAQAWLCQVVDKAAEGAESDEQIIRDLLFSAENNGSPQWQLVTAMVNQLTTSRFYRNVRIQMRPLMGVARLRNWHQRWADLYISPDARAEFVANNVDRGLFQVKTKEVEGEIQITDKWIKARLDFQIFPAWVGDFFGTAFMADNGFAGAYLLVQEGNRPRWAYFDSLTIRLGAMEAKKKLVALGYKLKATELARQFVTLQIDPANNVAIGNAFHHMHYEATQARLYKTLQDGSKEWKSFPTYANHKIHGQVISVLLEEQLKWLQGYKFGYTLKPKKGQLPTTSSCVVLLPYFFGANNKLASEADKASWFISSKMWSVLHTFGLMKEVPTEDGFSLAAERWKNFWGFDYPVKNRFRSDSDMDVDTSADMQAKMTLPWLNADLARNGDEMAGRGLAATLHGYEPGYKAFGGHVYGFPMPQAALEHTVAYYYGKGKAELPKEQRNGLQKVVCSFMGLSSVEYQLENLKKGGVSEYTKHIARAWNGTRISGLRDLFGALHVGQGWKVQDSWYIGAVEFGGNQKRLEALIKEAWGSEHNHPAYVYYKGIPADPAPAASSNEPASNSFKLPNADDDDFGR